MSRPRSHPVPHPRPRLHLICNAHLDPVWQWRWEEGCAEALTTFRTAVTLLREHPDFVFNHNEAVLYRWVQRYDPPLFRDIQELVKAQRWCISGGWYLQPDANLPGLEGFIRQIHEGRRFFARHFGVRPRVACNYDSFGHCAGLPQILRRCGFEMYIHLRPEARELALPGDLYRWQGVDGSEVAALRISVGLYHTERGNIEQRLREGTDLALRLQRDVPVFWGLGDHGGGATRDDLRTIEAFRAHEARVEVLHSTTERLYEALADAARSAPLVVGDIQRTNTGCYTSLSRIKRRARHSLARLVQAEAVCTTAWWLNGSEYPADELASAWRHHLFNDFHDILPGSCTAAAEQDALDLYGQVAEQYRGLRLGAAVALNRSPMPAAAIPVSVLNTNPAATRVPVEFECMVDYRPLWTGQWHLRLADLDGRPIPCQEEQPQALLPFNGWRRKVAFLADLPAVGKANFRVEVCPGAPAAVTPPAPALPHRYDPQAGLVTALDAGEGRNLLSGPLLEPLLIRDEADSWGSGCGAYTDVLDRFVARPELSTVVAAGPIRTISESVLTCGGSRILLHTISYPAWPVLEFRLRITWNEQRRMLKLRIPTALVDAVLSCEVPGGLINRPADGQEHVHGRWLMLQGRIAGRPAALGLVNSGQHGLDFADGELRLSVVRSAAYCHERGLALGPVPAHRYMDQGEHEVRLLVTSGTPQEVLTRLPGLADWLDAPPLAWAHLPLGGSGMAGATSAPAVPASSAASPAASSTAASTASSTAASTASSTAASTASSPALPTVLPSDGTGASMAPPGWVELLRVAPPTVRLTAAYAADDDRALILRLHETIGQPSIAEVGLMHPAVTLRRSLGPFELVTLRIAANGAWHEVDAVPD